MTGTCPTVQMGKLRPREERAPRVSQAAWGLIWALLFTLCEGQ